MSIEIYVFSDRQLNSIEGWQTALGNEGSPLLLDRSRSFDKLSGYLPATREGREAGFECDHWDPADIFESNPDLDFQRPWRHCLAFRVGGDFSALWGAYAAAAAYARATEGIVFDGESGDLLTPDEAAKLTLGLEQDIGNFE